MLKHINDASICVKQKQRGLQKLFSYIKSTLQ